MAGSEGGVSKVAGEVHIRFSCCKLSEVFVLVGELAAGGCICGRCLQDEALVRLLFWSWWLECRDDSLSLVSSCLPV